MLERNSYWERFWRRRLSRRALMKGILLAGGATAASIAVGCEEEKPAPATPTPEGTPIPAALTPVPGGQVNAPLVGLSSGNPPSLDPYKTLSYLAQIPAHWHYSRLLKFAAGPNIDPQDYSQVVGDLAERWETPDEVTVILHLRPNVRFHNVPPINGRPLDKDDILFSVQRLTQESPNRFSWNAVVDSAQAPDDRTVIIKFKQPFAPALNLLASYEHLRIQPKELIEAGLQERPVGTGPYIFEGFEKDVAIRWRKNPDYFIPGRPLADRWTASLVADPSTIIANLKTGTFDFSLLAVEVYETAKREAPNLVFTFTKNQVIGGIYFNFDIPPWNDVRVRQALSMAMDRDGILKALDPTGKGGWFTAISQLVPFWLDPKSPEFGPNAKYFQRNIAEAKKLLEAAGYPNGIKTKMTYSPGYGKAYEQLFTLVAATVKEAGFEFELAPQEYAAYLQTTFVGKFTEGVAIGPLQVPMEPDSIFFTVYHPGSARHNWGGSGPATPEGDKQLLDMFEAQRRELNFQRRVALIYDIQRYMAEKMYMVPYTANPGVGGWQPWVRVGTSPTIYTHGGYGWAAEVGIDIWLAK